MITLSHARNLAACGHNDARKPGGLAALIPFAGLRVTFLERLKGLGFGTPLVILEKASVK
jgi:hypothetical protein